MTSKMLLLSHKYHVTQVKVQLYHLQFITVTCLWAYGSSATGKKKPMAGYCQLVQQHKASQATTCGESHNTKSVTICQQELHCEGDKQEVWQYFLSRDGSGSKWPPVHKVQEQLYEKQTGQMQRLLTIYSTSLSYSFNKFTL